MHDLTEDEAVAIEIQDARLTKQARPRQWWKGRSGSVRAGGRFDLRIVPASKTISIATDSPIQEFQSSRD